ncbi:hypothetical protein KFK09_021660 [Dendrobium nobile]|uniref:Uncharacterized protein n=1 Tax=Dendrobium nobile TaxID=94219 RepID=A0A8T3AQQ8_DENNO|nr:hypothetical protein KFK09_021660 [Dendrobium nobile]
MGMHCWICYEWKAVGGLFSKFFGDILAQFFLWLVFWMECCFYAIGAGICEPAGSSRFYPRWPLWQPGKLLRSLGVFFLRMMMIAAGLFSPRRVFLATRGYFEHHSRVATVNPIGASARSAA